MNTFTHEECGRTEIFGSQGELRGDGRKMVLRSFLDGSSTKYDFTTSAKDGHGGGDAGLMEAFISAVRSGNSDALGSNLEDALTAHQLVFAAEASRQSGTVQEFRQAR